MCKTDSVIRKILIIIFVCLGVIVVISGLWYGASVYPSVFIYFAAMAAVLFAAKLIYSKINRVGGFVWTQKIPEWTVFALLIALCLAVKLLWVIYNRTVPYADDYTFWRGGAELAQNSVIPPDSYIPKYFALFPHLFGYSSFISILFSLFNTTSPLVAAIANAVLSVVSMAFIYYIVKTVKGRSAAVVASVIWILLPSQTMMNSYVLADTYYTTLLLAAFSLWIFQDSRRGMMSYPARIAIIGLSAILLSLANSARPVGFIVLIAAFIVLLISRFLTASSNEKLRICTLFLAFIAVFGICGKLNSMYLEKRVGYKGASDMGYTFFVGLNTDTYGTWSESDSRVLEYHTEKSEPFSANEIQRDMTGEAARRLEEESKLDIAYIMTAKIGILWSSDASHLYYVSDSVKPAVEAFYYIMWILAIWGVLSMFKDKCRAPFILLILYSLGLTAAHMIVEVAGRYHYSGLPALCIFAAVGFISFIKSHSPRRRRAPAGAGEPPGA